MTLDRIDLLSFHHPTQSRPYSFCPPLLPLDTHHHLHTKASSTNSKPCFVTYWLNALQHLKTDTDVFVSLNPVPAPAPLLVHRKMSYSHPQYSPEGADAQIGE